MGEKVPQDMDGKILKEIFKDNFLSSHPAQFDSSEMKEEVTVPEYSEGEEKYIRDKLKGLGYIE
jgi:hypothetical protein